MITDWDDAYKNGDYIPGAGEYVNMWETKARMFRDALPAKQQEIDISYGPRPRELFDLFLPESTPKGLLMFVHGGYWRALDWKMWSHLAAGPIAHGWAVAMPGYTLCPTTTIDDITDEIAYALVAAADKVDGPIHLAGHSAGGHLVTRMGCTDIVLDMADRIKRITSISGVHDLRPLTRTSVNDDLHLTLETATAQSPVFKTPRTGFDLTCWVGAAERPEFVRQNALLANIWTGCGVNTNLVEAEGHNHFTVIGDLADPDSALTNAVLGD